MAQELSARDSMLTTDIWLDSMEIGDLEQYGGAATGMASQTATGGIARQASRDGGSTGVANWAGAYTGGSGGAGMNAHLLKSATPEFYVNKELPQREEMRLFPSNHIAERDERDNASMISQEEADEIEGGNGEDETLELSHHHPVASMPDLGDEVEFQTPRGRTIKGTLTGEMDDGRLEVMTIEGKSIVVPAAYIYGKLKREPGTGIPTNPTGTELSMQERESLKDNKGFYGEDKEDELSERQEDRNKLIEKYSARFQESHDRAAQRFLTEGATKTAGQNSTRSHLDALDKEFGITRQAGNRDEMLGLSQQRDTEIESVNQPDTPVKTNESIPKKNRYRNRAMTDESLDEAKPILWGDPTAMANRMAAIPKAAQNKLIQEKLAADPILEAMEPGDRVIVYDDPVEDGKHGVIENAEGHGQAFFRRFKIMFDDGTVLQYYPYSPEQGHLMVVPEDVLPNSMKQAPAEAPVEQEEVVEKPAPRKPSMAPRRMELAPAASYRRPVKR